MLTVEFGHAPPSDEWRVISVLYSGPGAATEPGQAFGEHALVC